ncbi:hypothetical protein ACFYOY_36310, partial [Streptomyces sp. NPDC007875]|uniref:hypothetical protein n=1 Tax=Streptomyces sp. NPDC007875 TaxID=3364783 RepID=UPI0036BD6365
MPSSAECVSQTVRILELSARVAESGHITHLPVKITPVGWAAWYRGDWQLVAQTRMNDEVRRLKTEIETAEPPADVAHLWPSAQEWRASTVRTAMDDAYERVVEEMRREALTAIDAKAADFLSVEWVESTAPYLVQGEWTVTVSVRGTDHAAVRDAFAASLDSRRDEIVADAQKRIPRISGTFPAPRDTPEKVRKAWRRDRRKGTVPKPASGAFAPGGWVRWQHPESGEMLTGIVSRWLQGERTDSARRTVFP